MTFVEKFRNPQEIDVNGKTITISSIPAVPAIAVFKKYIDSIKSNGSIGVSMLEEDDMVKVLSYTAITADDGGKIPLDTLSAINSNLDAFDIMTVLKKMYDKNFSFFDDGRLLALMESESKSAT